MPIEMQRQTKDMEMKGGGVRTLISLTSPNNKPSKIFGCKFNYFSIKTDFQDIISINTLEDTQVARQNIKTKLSRYS